MNGGLQLARQLGEKDMIIYADSQLVAKQMNDEYEFKELFAGFGKVQKKQLTRSDNTRTNALSKFASSIVIEQRGKNLLEYRDTPSCDMQQVLTIDQEETLITHLVRTLQGVYDNLDKKELIRLQRKAARVYHIEMGFDIRCYDVYNCLRLST
ncbi:reverse transcriptase [Gossypium australe]|uniref:Reverse transcriptase n=1 Tax=Gossypium australe TaxID=47621 RepID=A0A5B6VK34_9ROSI|nr:reverse transcriptase [Gossypium australe]